MDSTSGLILDIYDDFSGETLRSLYPTPMDIPDTVKTASLVDGASRERLPDDAFALVLVNNGEKLRKYACVDPGNTALSVAYFLKHAHKLPLEAQKTAASNLTTACGWYDLPVPEPLEKIALGLLGAAMAIPTVLGAAGAIKGNLGAARQAGGQLVNPAMLKAAEVNGTSTAPMEGPGTPSPAPSKTTINKTARVGHLVRHAGTAPDPDVVPGVSGEMHKEAPQAKHLRPTVDVSNAKPPTIVREKKASHYALETEGRYPIDSYAQVKAASAYFDTYRKFLSVDQRREYAVNLVKQAEAMGIETSAVAQKYGSQELANETEIKIAFDARRLELQAYPDSLRLLDEVENAIISQGGMKLASLALHPREACELLAEFDRQTGLDRSYDKTVPDAYYSIYGTKTASEAAWSDLIGNDYVTYADLRRLSHLGIKALRDTFGQEFQEEFRKDPVAMYSSMPRDQKKMIIHMAQNTAPGAEPAY